MELATQEPPRPLQPIVDLRVRLAHRLAREPLDFVGEASVGADRVEGGEVVVPPGLTVDLTEGRSEMDDAGTFVRLDELAGNHPPPVDRAVPPRLEIGEGPVVAEADQVAAADPRGGHPSSPSTWGASSAATTRSPTTAYSRSGPTAAPVLERSVHGVVVHATSEIPSSVSTPSRARRCSAASPSSRSGKRT